MPAAPDVIDLVSSEDTDSETERMELVPEPSSDTSANGNDGNDGELEFDDVRSDADGFVYVYYTDAFYANIKRMFRSVRYLYDCMQLVRSGVTSSIIKIVETALELLSPYNDFISANGNVCVHAVCQRRIMMLSKRVYRLRKEARSLEGPAARNKILELLYLVLAFAHHFLDEADPDRRRLSPMLEELLRRLQRDPLPNFMIRMFHHDHDKLCLFGDPDGRLHAPETAPVF